MSLFLSVIETLNKSFRFDQEHTIIITTGDWSFEAPNISSAHTRDRKLDFHPLLGPTERDEQGDYQEGPSVVLVSQIPVSIEVKLREQSNAPECMN